MSEEGTNWTQVGGQTASESLTRALERGPITPFTPKPERGLSVSGVEISPASLMSQFTRDVQRSKDEARNAERSIRREAPRVETTFSASPMVPINSPPPGGRRTVVGGTTTAEAEAAVSTGAFCSIYEDAANPGDWYIRGGSVPAVGDKNFSIPPFLINSADNTYRIYIPVNVEINRATGGSYFLPDVKTSSDDATPGVKVMVETTGAYPSNTLPDVSDGLGLIHLLVGEVVVTSGVPTLFETGCGSFHIESCMGSLTYRTR